MDDIVPTLNQTQYPNVMEVCVFTFLFSLFLLVIFNTGAVAQGLGNSLEFQMSQVSIEHPGHDRIVKIDQLLKKALSGGVPGLEESALVSLVEMRETECLVDAAACMDVSTWLMHFCDKGKTPLEFASVPFMWSHLSHMAKTAALQTALFNQVKATCSKPESSKSLTQALEMLITAIDLKSTLEPSVHEWIRKTWPSPPSLDSMGLRVFKKLSEKLDGQSPRPMDTKKLLALLLMPTLKGMKKLSPGDIELFSSTVTTLVSVGQDKAALELIDSDAATLAFTERPTLMLPILGAACALWHRSGQLQKCDKQVESLRANTTLQPSQLLNVDLTALQVLYFRGQLDEFEKEAVRILNKSQYSAEVGLWTHFSWAITLQDLGKLKEAEEHLNTHTKMLLVKYPNVPWLKLMGDDARVVILTQGGKYKEAKALSDEVIAGLKKYFRGPIDIAGWVYFDRLLLAVTSHDSAEIPKAKADLNKTLANLPGLSFLGDIGTFLIAPAGAANGKLALEKAIKVLGPEHPLIKKVQRLVSPAKPSK